MLNLNRLHILQEFHRLGTITAVAESMNYSRSAISQQMALLEKEIGVKLFEKAAETSTSQNKAKCWPQKHMRSWQQSTMPAQPF